MQLKKKYKLVLICLLVITIGIIGINYKPNNNKETELENNELSNPQKANLEGLVIYQDKSTIYLCDENQIIYPE